jgi:hypothetical protein
MLLLRATVHGAVPATITRALVRNTMVSVVLS